jgi:hypothetical protein
MSDQKKEDEEKKPEEEVPESWNKFLDLAHTVLNVPKEEIEQLIEEERRHKESRNEEKNRMK